LKEERRQRVFENSVFRLIFGRKRDEVTGEWRNLHNEELYDLYSPNSIRVIKSKRIRGAGNVVHMGKRRGVYRVLVGKQEERDQLEHPGVDGRKILRWIFRKWDGGVDCIDLAHDRDR
jgi:hypothetical protein